MSNLTEASRLFRGSGRKILDPCKAVLEQGKQEISNILMEMGGVEERACTLLKDIE